MAERARMNAECFTPKAQRLCEHRDAIHDPVRQKYLQSGTVAKVLTSRKIAKRARSVGMKK